MHRGARSWVVVAAVVAAAGCEPDLTGIFETTTSGTGGGSSGGGGAGATGGASTSPAGGSGGSGGATTTTTTTTTGSGTTTTTTGCDASDPNGDQDGDGFSPAQGDCDDCDAEVNPGAIEIPGGGDENCNGTIDEPLETCDDAIALDTVSAGDVVKAMELCKVAANEKDWGVTITAWSLPDGSAVPVGNQQQFHMGHGVLAGFGAQTPPRAGKRLVALSSGTARTPDDPGYQSTGGYSKGYQSAHAPGFPKESASCSGATTGTPHDAAVLNVGIRVPTNAHGLSYDFSFYAHDFPAYVCSAFNDTFFGILEPFPAGQADGNIAYDELGNPVTLNGAHFRACSCQNGPPCQGGGKTYDCPLGAGPLLGSGFDQAATGQSRGATGWLRTTVPVEAGTYISLRWGVYDAGDGAFDSTVILDNWQWITDANVVKGTTIAP